MYKHSFGNFFKIFKHFFCFMCSWEMRVTRAITLVTSEQCVHAYVAEGEANDGGFVQVSSDRGLEWQETRQISKHI